MIDSIVSRPQRNTTPLCLALAIVLYTILGCGRVEDPGLEPAYDSETAPPAPTLVARPRQETRQAFFGDLHVHTSYSSDAFIFGVRALPDDAYLFAKGGTIAHGAGYPIRLSKPLDFLAVTDHAEYLGVVRATWPDLPLTERPLREILLEGKRASITKAMVGSVAALMRKGFGHSGSDPAVELDAWREIIAAAERHNDPGRFTAFIGYEWSSDGIHRNVVYGASQVPDRPFSSLDSDRPQDLWQALDKQVRSNQPVIAIPHNGNESNGRIYPETAIEGLTWTAEEAALRNRIEPVSEIYQVKGSSETHPELSPEDPFAAFEIIDQRQGRKSEPAGSYTRRALLTGLALSLDEGWNPYQMGVIGSSDSHNASSVPEESAHHGKLPMLDGSAGIRSGEAVVGLPSSQMPGATWGGGGLAGVWAEENTRASLFEALRRKETFATSGPRMRVRFFGGWNFNEPDLRAPNAISAAYSDGVPMGGTLSNRPTSVSGAPRFLIGASKDPEAANLDRAQIIKGWVDADGMMHERIYDVAVSDGRQPDPVTHLAPPVGNTVDVANATYTNTIGATEFTAQWQDPDFDPAVEAFYYVRVLEIPTPRMSTFDARTLGIEAPEPTAIQERAATSAIWYRP